MTILFWIVLGVATGAVVHRIRRPFGSLLLGAFVAVALSTALISASSGGSALNPLAGVAVALGVLSGYRVVAVEIPTGRRGIFLSHRSVDANLARQVAEQLIAAGLWVWIDEYEVSLDNYDDWEEEVHSGIQDSLAGMALVGRRFANSNCRGEMDEMLACHGPEGVFVVESEETRGDAVRAWPELVASTRIESDDPEVIAAAVRSAAPFRTAPWRRMPTRADPCALDGVMLGVPYQWDATGWKVTDRGGRTVAGREVAGPSLTLIGGGEPVHCNLYAGPQEREPIKKPPADGTFDESKWDRLVYLSTMKQARRMFSMIGQVVTPDASERPQEVGKHLFFHDGVGQLAVSYRMPGYWSRKYSLLLEDAPSGVSAEFVFTFGVGGPFERFCAFGRTMDTLVQSFRWGTVSP